VDPSRTSIEIDLGGRAVAVPVRERRGSADLLLLVHGLGAAKECFDQAWQAPELLGLSLLAPDLPGHGDLPLAAGLDCSMEACAELLRELLRLRPFERLHVVAHSMGAAPALLVAEGQPRLASFVNVEGNLVAEDCGILSRRSAELPLERLTGGKLQRLVSSAARSEDPSLRRWAAWLGRCEPRAFHQACRSVVEWSDSERLLEIFLGLAVPKLYLCGERSAVPEVLERLAAVPLVQLPDTGHDLMNERPGEFYRQVARLISPS